MFISERGGEPIPQEAQFFDPEDLEKRSVLAPDEFEYALKAQLAGKLSDLERVERIVDQGKQEIIDKLYEAHKELSLDPESKKAKSLLFDVFRPYDDARKRDERNWDPQVTFEQLKKTVMLPAK